MKNSRLFKRLAKSSGARALALMAAILLVAEPLAFAFSQTVDKYPTGTPVIGSVDMGGGNILYYGDVFGFNSAKNTTAAFEGSEAASPPDVYAEIREGACRPEGTSYDFGTGTQGWIGTTAATGLSYMYDGVIGAGSIKAYFGRKSTSTAAFTWEKAFFYDCGGGGTATFSMKYVRDVWVNPSATPSDNNFSVTLVRPDATTKLLVNAQTILDTGSVLTAPTYNLPVDATDFTQVGTYKLRITGNLKTLNSGGSKVAVAFDDINLTITPVAAYTSFQQDVQFVSTATPFSSLGGAGNGYKLEIRARKAVDDAEATYVDVCNAETAEVCTDWGVPKYTIPGDAVLDGQENAWALYDTYYLTDAEYNNGKVRVRYRDAVTGGDSSQGGVDVEFQRVRVNQSTCVDSVRDIEADCGKCHNYNSNVVKPWPTLGMHNKHAQTESVSDCLWCHPNNGSDSAHRNNVVTIDGTKVYKLGTSPTNGGTATWDSATGRCSNVDCHKGNITPAWTATYPPTGPYDGINTIARNCSRCHNSGAAGADTYGEYNLAVAWPNDAGGGHASHNSAFTINELSCQTNGSCHPDNRGQHSKVGDLVVEVKMKSEYSSPGKTAKYLSASKTCANVACHGGQQTPAFNTANVPPGIGPIDVATACTKCHAPEKADGWLSGTVKALQYNAPLSGLHRGSPPTSGKNHIDYACTTCHNSPAKHFREGGAGTNTNLHTKDMDTVLPADIKVADIGYTAGVGTSPNYTTPPSCMTPATGEALPNAGLCHAETIQTNRNPTTKWARRWSWDAYDAVTPVNQCKNCHGHWGSFNAGVVQPHVTSNSDAPLLAALSSNHSDSGINCGTMCHAQNATLPSAYNHGVSMTATSKDMSLNANAGIVRTAGPPDRVGCSFCHAANDGSTPDGGAPGGPNHVFAESNWVTQVDHTDGPQPVCYNPGASTGCHGDGVSQYWPDDSPSSYPNRGGKHTFHINKLATSLGIGTTSDGDQKRLCQYCHPANPGAAGHTTNSGDSIADTSDFNPIWSTATPPTGDTAPAGAFSNDANATCSGIDCHNNQTTTAAYNWRTGGTSTCLMCHTVGGAGNNPTSGLHFGTLTVSANTHDDNFQVTKGGASTGTCTTCHTSTPSTAHINGIFTNSSPTINFAATVGFADSATPTCAPNGALSTCHTDGGTWTRKWSTTAKNSDGTECANCHGGFSGTDWTFGVGAALDNTTDYNVSHSRDWDVDATQNETYGNHSSNSANTNKCNTCHVYGDPAYVFGTHHNNGKITMNSTLGYSGTGYNCTTVCHDNNTNHNLEPSSSAAWATRGEAIAGPALSCTGCHGGASPKAGVSSTSPHVIRGNKAGYNTFNACTDCHPGGGVGTQHQSTGVVGIANNTTVGINYVSGVNGYTGFNGVVLGGDATTGATEAAICWNCHNNMTYQATAISEWGTNTKQTGSLSPTQYNYGSVTTPDWTTATWSSARTQFAYKTGAIQSTHTANPAVTDANLTGSAYGYTETKNAVADIRCSYCHDVHDNAASRGLAGDVSGKPFLRGTWWSNPYEEDGAPRSSYANTTYFPNTNTWGQVPRGSVNQNILGGYYIDQNNVQPGTATTSANGTAAKNPTSTWTLTGSAGLCTKCHGTTVDSMDQKTGEALWIGTNGHANSAIGGTGSGSANSSNIFDARGGTGATYSHNPSMHYNLMVNPAQNGTYGFRSNNSAGLKYQPQINAGSTRPLKWDQDEWVVDETGATKESQFHKFSCSKCHNPHASRLPKLMITNCLDTKHNTWDNQFQLNTSGGSNNNNREISNWTSAQNCHRYAAVNPNTGANEYRSGSSAGLGAGWNKVSPWTTTNPNP